MMILREVLLPSPTKWEAQKLKHITLMIPQQVASTFEIPGAMRNKCWCLSSIWGPDGGSSSVLLCFLIGRWCRLGHTSFLFLPVKIFHATRCHVCQFFSPARVYMSIASNRNLKLLILWTYDLLIFCLEPKSMLYTITVNCEDWESYQKAISSEFKSWLLTSR